MSSSDVDKWFDAVSSTQRGVLLEMRKMITTNVPGVVEEIKWSRPCYFNAHGLFCYLHSTNTHATLGFQKGALLEDPAGLLEGTGKEMRHVKLKPDSTVGDPELVSLIREAASR